MDPPAARRCLACRDRLAACAAAPRSRRSRVLSHGRRSAHSRKSRRATSSSSIRSPSRRRGAPSARSTSPRRSTRSTASTIHNGQPQVNLSETLVADSGRVRGKSAELRAGPADQLARIRRARRVRRARRAAVPGRHPGHDARRAGADRQLQPVVRAAHRNAARALLRALRQRIGRRDFGVHRGSAECAAAVVHRRRRQLRNRDVRRRSSADAQAAWAACRRRERVRHRRLSRSLVGAARPDQREARAECDAGRRGSR